ncbi:hypothetical protein L1765_01055 [Microaerobacter geothermalis]|nr:hypothetical protein [Microaerobacter geothermalis]
MMKILHKGKWLLLLAILFGIFMYSLNMNVRVVDKATFSFFQEPISKQPSSTNEQPSFFSLTLYDPSLTIQLTAEDERNEQYLSGKDLTYSVLEGRKVIGELFVQQLRFSNQDLYYFIRFTAEENLDRVIPLRITFPGIGKPTLHTLDYPGALSNQTSVWKEKMSIDSGESLPKGAFFLDGEDYFLFSSPIDVFLPLANGVRKERFEKSLSAQFRQEKGKVQLLLPLPVVKGNFTENWGMFSTRQLVDWRNENAHKVLKIADLNRVRKWSREGMFYVTPDSYEPTDPRGFWMNPAHHVGEVFLRTEGAIFFENFAVLSLYTAAETQNEQGFWPTTPRSNWLYNDYGINAGFYDTRFNTDAGLFLLRGYRKLGDETWLTAAVKYADFLVKFAQTHQYRTKNGGILVYDYSNGNESEEEQKKPIQTHVSLNHHITEMNFLYEMYKTMKNTTYFNIAEKMKQGVKDTAKDWKKEEDGDLWYAYLPDGTYGLKDYPLLTLKDLRYSQELITELYGVPDPDFQYLIQVKEEYLRKNNLPLY